MTYPFVFSYLVMKPHPTAAGNPRNKKAAPEPARLLFNLDGN